MRFIIDKSSNGQFYWYCKARNGEIIAVSETYTRKTGAQHSIDLIIGQASGAQVIDISDVVV